MYTRTLMFKRGEARNYIFDQVSTTFKKKLSLSKWLAEKCYLARYFSIWLMLPVAVLQSPVF